MGKYQSKTAKLYNAGLEVEKAVLLGADEKLFNEFEIEFKGGSIPVHLLHGFTYKAPYSCKYHNPLIAKKLIQLIKEVK